MSRFLATLLTDLRHLISDLGKGGGLMSPSVYDTAQVVRLAPPPEGPELALEWLLEQQQPDGGWVAPELPRARVVPTLAAVLALLAHGQRRSYREAAYEGVVYLRREAQVWADTLPNDLPVGIELLFPRLLEEARAADIDLPLDSYRSLLDLGARRRQLISQAPLQPGTTAVHSWEAFGIVPDPELFDAAGGIGHSPAATAAWLRATHGRADLEHPRAQGRAYLEQVARATLLDIPGVVPTAWPIARFERGFGTFALNLGGLIGHPALSELVTAHGADTVANLRPNGYSFSDAFDPNGDDTAAGVILAHLSGYQVNAGVLRGFERNGRFCTFPRELQISYSALARAAYALILVGEDAGPYLEDLMAVRSPDGRWAGDKWNSSWLYATCHAVHALLSQPDTIDLLAPTLNAVLEHQLPDGGWGTIGGPNPTETAYGVLTLLGLASVDAFRPLVRPALERAGRMLQRTYKPLREGSTTCWIGKEIYRPYRVDTAFELSATLAVSLYLESNYDLCDP